MSPDGILDRAEEIAAGAELSSHRPAINCSGTILNTGLGRARLPKAAVQAMRAVAESHSSLEIDLVTGKRGDRQGPLSELLIELTGAEDSYVVNNNAGAVLLAISTFASGRSVLLSRGQSVEIGGAFRMPDVVRAAGARLIDVGCTNKTKISDYSDAIEDDTNVLLRCHPSNFRVTGFVEEPIPSDLAAISQKLRLTMIDDIGSGCLYDTAAFGLPHEPTLSEAVKTGADVITASGDKLLGGPQAGIILGKKKAIARIRKNPLARALRVDKITAAGLEATLRLYANGEFERVPTYWALSRPLESVEEMAKRLLSEVGAAGEVADGKCEVGGGSLPGVSLPSKRVSFKSDDVEKLARRMLSAAVPVIGYVAKGKFWLDIRTVDEQDFPALVHELRRALK